MKKIILLAQFEVKANLVSCFQCPFAYWCIKNEEFKLISYRLVQAQTKILGLQCENVHTSSQVRKYVSLNTYHDFLCFSDFPIVNLTLWWTKISSTRLSVTKNFELCFTSSLFDQSSISMFISKTENLQANLKFQIYVSSSHLLTKIIRPYQDE